MKENKHMNSEQLLSGLKEGDRLPGLTKYITQERINLYAEASKDFNPVHIDPEYAKKTPLGGTIAHGMLSLSYISEMMTRAFEQYWLQGGSIDVRFKTPARPGDTVTVSGSIKKVDKHEDRSVLRCEVLCINQNDETIVTGETEVRINR
jgi:3-hydroxybutyryl-CoA dehydratase